MYLLLFQAHDCNPDETVTGLPTSVSVVTLSPTHQHQVLEYHFMDSSVDPMDIDTCYYTWRNWRFDICLITVCHLAQPRTVGTYFQISHCYLTEIMSTSAVVPTIFTTHQVSSSFRRNAAIDKNNLSVIISYICQWENISGMRAWMAYQCFVMLFNGSISCCWWPAWCHLATRVIATMASCVSLHGQHWCK